MEIIGMANVADPERREFLLAYQDRFEQSNDDLVDSLLIRTPKIKEAMKQCPRNEFAGGADIQDALTDRPLIMRQGFNISAPHMHAMLLEGLDLKPSQRVLDIGSGSGLLSAYAAYIVGPQGSVVGVDILEEATELAEDNLRSLCARSRVFREQAGPCKFHTHNIFLPAPEALNLADFDRIVVGAGCPERKTEWLLSMLKAEGGILVTPMVGGSLERTVMGTNGRHRTDCLSIVRFKDLEVPSDQTLLRAMLAVERQALLAAPRLDFTYAKDMAHLGSGSSMALEINAGIKRSRSSSVGGTAADKATHVQDVISCLGPFDCKLQGAGWSLPAHRRLLELRCDLCRAQSCSGMRDSEAEEIHVPEDFPKGAVETFLVYCYEDRLEASHFSALSACLRVASYYGTPYLVHLCEVGLAALLEGDTGDAQGTAEELAPMLLSLADEFNLLHLQSWALDYISTQYTSVAKTEAYKDLTKQQTDLVAAHACAQLAAFHSRIENL